MTTPEASKAEDLEGYRAWLESEKGQKPTDPDLLEKWRQNLHQEASAYARGERPLVTAMEEGTETRGSWQNMGAEKKLSARERSQKKRIYIACREVFISLLERNFVNPQDIIGNIEAKLEEILEKLKAKQGFGNLSAKEEGLLDELIFLQAHIPILKADEAIGDETVLFEVPDDLKRKMLTI